MLADILKQNNVDNSGMRFDPHARTALAFVTLTKEGEREFMFYRNPSADMLLQDKELDENLIKKASPIIFLYAHPPLTSLPCLHFCAFFSLVLDLYCSLKKHFLTFTC